MTCGATSSPRSRTTTAASRSTFRWARTPGRWPPGADRSATSLARLLLDCLDLLDVDDATVVANDTAGGLLLLSLATGHPALGRVGRLVLTNCESYDQFPPDALKKASAPCRALPGLARALIRLQLGRRPAGAGHLATVTASGLDHDRAESFFGPMRRDRRVADDLVAAMAGLPPAAPHRRRRGDPAVRPARPADLGRRVPLLPDGARAAARVRLPRATLVPVPGAKTWVPVDNPAAVADAIAEFVPAHDAA